jgi:alpha,alpha-trehalase
MRFKLDINKTLQQLLKQEDTDGDKRITVDDRGSKRFVLKSSSDEMKIEGTYYLY